MFQQYTVTKSENSWRNSMRPAIAQITLANIAILAHVFCAVGSGSP